MKLAFINPFLLRTKRGIERFVWSLAVGLAKHGDEVHLLTWGHPHPVDWGVMPENLYIHRVPYFRYYARYLSIPFYTYWLASQKFDQTIVAFAGYGEPEALKLANYLTPQNYSIVFHFPIEQVPHRYKEFAQDSFAQRAHKRIAVSEYVADGVKRTFNRDCLVIPNGVDPLVFSPSAEVRQGIREQFSVAPEAMVIITLAALEERKGIQWVLHAMPHLLNDFPSLEYWVLGQGLYRETLEAKIRSLGLAGHVRLWGSVDDVVPYLASADVGCLLSSGEAFGMALLEYMSMQLPVISSNHAPFPEIVQPEWGVMVDAQQVEEVVQALRDLLSDPARRTAMGVAGRAEVLRRYTWKQIARMYHDTLAEDT